MYLQFLKLRGDVADHDYALSNVLPPVLCLKLEGIFLCYKLSGQYYESKGCWGLTLKSGCFELLVSYTSNWYQQRFTVCCNSIVRSITFCFLPSISPSGSVSSHPWPDLGAPLPVLAPPEAPLLFRLDGLLTDPDDRLLSPNDPLWPLRLPTEPRVPLAPPCLNALPTDRLVPLALLDLKAFSIEADLWSMLVRWAPVAAAALPTPVLWSRHPVLCFTLLVRRGQDSLTLLHGILERWSLQVPGHSLLVANSQWSLLQSSHYLLFNSQWSQLVSPVHCRSLFIVGHYWPSSSISDQFFIFLVKSFCYC